MAMNYLPIPFVSVTVIVPFYNEAENILPLARELAAVRAGVKDLTALFVDDGSTDDTWRAIQQAAGLYPWIGGLHHSRNRGQSAALLNGMHQAAGDVIVTMDGDLQNAPADIPVLLEPLVQCDVVCGCRSRRGDTLSKRMGSVVANRVRQWITHDGIQDTGCGLKAFRRECISDLPPLNGMHRFMPAYFMLHGRRITQVPVNYRPRQHGVSKYSNLGRLPATLFDLLGFCWYRSRLLIKK
jgi:dolichol-phosphate mannosyltransferase